MTTERGSVTIWIERLKAGESTAAEPLFTAYFRRLVGLARQQLRGLRGAPADEEDVALSAFDSFCRAAEAGRFPRLDDREDLWQMLLLITARKAVDLRRREMRAKRGGGKVFSASALAGEPNEAADDFARVMGREPTPELAVQAAEECRRLLEELGDAELRAVALAKLENYTNAEIAGRLNRSLATVERKLGLIRKLWEREVDG
jgi:DNA-directed RNA polymerase specialized sigma24 family protein